MSKIEWEMELKAMAKAEMVEAKCRDKGLWEFMQHEAEIEEERRIYGDPKLEEKVNAFMASLTDEEFYKIEDEAEYRWNLMQKYQAEWDKNKVPL
jgi:hypothetical protein